MNRASIYQIVGTYNPQYQNGFVISNSCDVASNKYGVFSLGAGIGSVGFNDTSNASNPLYQSIITSNCVLAQMYVTLCQSLSFNDVTGFVQDFSIYQNGNLVYSVGLDGTTEVLFPIVKINIPFAIGDLISFSLDNTASDLAVTITLHTFFENA
jgi:hypothetical protein